MTLWNRLFWPRNNNEMGRFFFVCLLTLRIRKGVGGHCCTGNVSTKSAGVREEDMLAIIGLILDAFHSHVQTEI